MRIILSKCGFSEILKHSKWPRTFLKIKVLRECQEIQKAESAKRLEIEVGKLNLRKKSTFI